MGDKWSNIIDLDNFRIIIFCDDLDRPTSKYIVEAWIEESEEWIPIKLITQLEREAIRAMVESRKQLWYSLYGGLR